ncbi:hypothetical protein LCGC14_1765800 [marine sediment metagenome]|uniref:Uncharacterized protein n=1 Tax=marine sediment metagenome TaxID=412755 RepID=A0A0F9GZP7_9ZZZZ
MTVALAFIDLIDLINAFMVAGLLWLTLLRERHIRTLQTQLDESHTVMAEQHLALCLAAGDDPEEVAVRMAAKIRNEATH